MSIEVHVRIRPHVPNGVWSSAETVLYSTHNPNTRYVYNKVHHIGTTNQVIFHGLEALIHAGFDGKNVTVMAYGQTGSGKTHSMNGSDTDPGVVPRTAKLLLDLRKNFPGTQIVAYFTEIYNESVKDLLEPQRGELALHDAPDGGVYFDKKSVPIETISDFTKLQSIAERNRKYGVTNLNDHSSRSHMILTFEIHRSHRQASTINLVDLAGSESASRANTEGVSLREGGFINKSLLTLGNVVDAIVEKRSYVPYRDAKLTRILRNCLGGSGMTFVLCCINPSHENFEQTVASLRFTQRAMKIKNDPVMVLNMPPLFTHQYSMGAEELARGFPELGDAYYQRGLRDAFMYTNNTMSSVVSNFEGQVSDSLHAMANAQRLLIAHDHAIAVEQVGRLYNQLHEITRQKIQSQDIEERELKRQRDTINEIDNRKNKIARMEADVKVKATDADTELAGWEYQLYEARQRRVSVMELLLTSERSGRSRVQYEWAVCMERIAARCVPAIKALGPVTPPVADKKVVLQQMRLRLQEARDELNDLTIAHDMIKGDLPELVLLEQQEKENGNESEKQLQQQHQQQTIITTTEIHRSPSMSTSYGSHAVSLSPQPRMEGGVALEETDIDERIQQLEREEKLLMTRAVHAARCESTRKLRESLRGAPRSRTPPTSRSVIRRYSSTPPPTSQQQQQQQQQKQLKQEEEIIVVEDESPIDVRGGTGCYASPVKQQRSPTPRTARTIFPTAVNTSPDMETLFSADMKHNNNNNNTNTGAAADDTSSPQNEQLADGVRRALGVLRDVRSKLMRPAQERRRKADITTSNNNNKSKSNAASISVSPLRERAPSSSRRARRTQSHTPVEDEMTLAEVYFQRSEEKNDELNINNELGAPVIGIAARRRLEGAPVRPTVERALWRLSLSPAGNSFELPERARSRRR